MTRKILVMPTKIMEFSFYPIKVPGLALRPQTFRSLLGGHIAACLYTMQENQVIEFKQVDSTRALTTSEELKRSLLLNNLDIKNCIAFQSENCNAMVAADRILLSDDMQSLADDDFNGGPLNILFVVCCAHRLNNCILDSVIDIPFSL